MSKSHKHHVKLHRWHNGELRTLDAEFEHLEDALEYVSTTEFHQAKVYDDQGQLVHEAGPAAGESYA
jgi:hypothetical protein